MDLPRALASALTATLLAAGCGTGASQAPQGSPAPVTTTAAETTGPTASSVTASGCTVGVSWAERAGRWQERDEPAIKARITGAGGTYLSTDAALTADIQAANVDTLITQGADVLIVVAQDSTAIRSVVANALRRDVAVIAYDRLIDDPAALYISFDNVEVGRMQARAVLAAAPKGNYLFIKGDAADPNSDLLRSGQTEVLAASIASGDIVNAGEAYTKDWSPDAAVASTTGFLATAHNQIAGVLAQNDGMAEGVIAALDTARLAGSVAVSGQDGSLEGLRAVALGTQTVDVWKDDRALGAAAGAAAMQLCAGRTAATVEGTAAFTTPSGAVVRAILIPPVAITRANLDVVVAANWIGAAELCAGIAPGSVPACP